MNWGCHWIERRCLEMRRVILPESKTKSFKSRPWFPNNLRRFVKLLVGGGMLFTASDDLEIVPSLRPVGTVQEGPPCKWETMYKNTKWSKTWSIFLLIKGKIKLGLFLIIFWVCLTVATIESLATKATVSAQETTPGHLASRRLFTLSMKSKPLSVRFGPPSFSAVLLDVEFRSTDPSQPWKRHKT